MFYIFGALCCLWIPFFWFLSADEPSKMKNINPVELDYLTAVIWKGDHFELLFLIWLLNLFGTINHHKKAVQKNSDKETPWINISLSLPFIGICISHFSFNYMFYNQGFELFHYLLSVIWLDRCKKGHEITPNPWKLAHNATKVSEQRTRLSDIINWNSVYAALHFSVALYFSRDFWI